MSRWAILCPGKSLATLDSYDVVYDGEQVIAVNYAILYKSIFPSYWAMLDGEVLKECAARTNLAFFARLPVPLWIPDNFENSGRTAEWEYSHFEAYRSFPSLKHKNLDQMLAQPAFQAKIAWQSYSLFTAVGLAVLMGAKEINVYGADFDGQGYFLDGLGNFRTDHRPARWKRESEEFDRIQKVLQENGITVMRHGGAHAHV
jgi:hypothetical protein